MADDRVIIEQAGRRGGLVVVRELRAAGLSARQIERRLESGLLFRVVGPVLQLGSRPLDHRSLALACCLADEGSVAGWGVAAATWKLRGVELPMVDVLRPTGRPLEVRGVRWHRMRALHPTDVVVSDDGLRVTSPPLTLFHLAWYLTPEQLESAVEDALARRLCTAATLDLAGRRLCRPGRPGSVAFRVLMEDRQGRAPAGSGLELRLERALLAVGLPRPVRQHAVRAAAGLTFHLDLAWPDLCLGIEVDGASWHSGRAATARDKQRDRWLAAASWQIVRVVDEDIDGDVGRAAGEVAAVYEARREVMSRRPTG